MLVQLLNVGGALEFDVPLTRKAMVADIARESRSSLGVNPFPMVGHVQAQVKPSIGVLILPGPSLGHGFGWDIPSRLLYLYWPTHKRNQGLVSPRNSPNRCSLCALAEVLAGRANQGLTVAQCFQESLPVTLS